MVCSGAVGIISPAISCGDDVSQAVGMAGLRCYSLSVGRQKHVVVVGGALIPQDLPGDECFGLAGEDKLLGVACPFLSPVSLGVGVQVAQGVQCFLAAGGGVIVSPDAPGRVVHGKEEPTTYANGPALVS